MLSDLLRILRESIKAVPAMKYALAVAGILAVVAMVGAFKLSPQMAVFGAVITLVLMVAMVIFARLTTTASRHFLLPAKIMMWSFLVVTVSTAFLLFTSAFFHWPRGLRDLLNPTGAGPAVRNDRAETGNLIAAARGQLAAQDYSGAWTTIGRALKLAPDSTSAREAQVDIAMEALRRIAVPESQTFTGVMAPYVECLHLALTTAQGIRAADIQAHLGWAKALRFRETGRDTNVAADYAAAVARDDTNPFARAMWGHWLGVQKKPLPEIHAQFAAALRGGRERELVQEFRIHALSFWNGAELPREYLLIADELRRNREDLPLKLRRMIFREAYLFLGRRNEAALLAILAPADHLATLQWIGEGDEKSDTAIKDYLLARFTEAAGDTARAAKLYRAQLGKDSVFEPRIEAGLARCEARTHPPTEVPRE